MRKINLKQIILGCLLLSSSHLLMGKFSFPQLSRIVAASQQLFTSKNKTYPSRTIQIYNDLEDDLEYILNVDSLKDLTDQLTVHANGVHLVQDQLSTIPLSNNVCTFSVQFPMKALFETLKKEKMQLLLKTYEDDINEFLKNNVNTHVRQFCTTHYDEWWFKILLKIPKLEINFTYEMSEHDLEKQSLSLLAIVLRKREELEKVIKQGQLSSGWIHYSPLKTIVVTIKP